MPRLQHVTVPIPEGAQDEGRTFYAGVLGLREKIVPGTRSDAGLVWFEAGPGELEVHLAPDPVGLVEGARRHFCLVVDDLEEARARIEAGGAPIAEAPPIPGRRSRVPSSRSEPLIRRNGRRSIYGTHRRNIAP